MVRGIICLLVAAVVTLYSYNLLSLVLEHYADIGQRQLRFRDMARDILAFFSVAVSGYWEFGKKAQATVLVNFMVDGKPLLPTWVLLMTNVFALLQLTAFCIVNLQPTSDVLERKFADPKRGEFSIRNVLPKARPTILTNFMGDGKPLLPSVIQLLHSYAIGCHH
ncbi:hypothetical protein POTOM_038935 [Populus tomentosa]|uniref:Uncharacterized protein n=1 Tax=Populus tomentosa TaxID=118781 RepID=A0A8X7YX21_POPTO|nr:hypothetical protein POTOM_038935 [Populus tomentosa]